MQRRLQEEAAQEEVQRRLQEEAARGSAQRRLQEEAARGSAPSPPPPLAGATARRWGRGQGYLAGFNTYFCIFGIRTQPLAF